MRLAKRALTEKILQEKLTHDRTHYYQRSCVARNQISRPCQSTWGPISRFVRPSSQDNHGLNNSFYYKSFKMHNIFVLFKFDLNIYRLLSTKREIRACCN